MKCFPHLQNAFYLDGKEIIVQKAIRWQLIAMLVNMRGVFSILVLYKRVSLGALEPRNLHCCAHWQVMRRHNIDTFSRGPSLWQGVLVPILGAGVIARLSESLELMERTPANMRVVEEYFMHVNSLRWPPSPLTH